MRTVYVIMGPDGKPSRVSLTKPKLDPVTKNLKPRNGMKEGESVHQVKLSSGQSILSWNY